MVHDSHYMREVLQLLDEANFGVLATIMEAQPYANIVAFLACDNGQKIIFATPRTTRKYVNLKRSPRASILIDNRGNQPDDYMTTKGVNALGQAEEVTQEAELKKYRKAFLKRHPMVRDFCNSPTTAFFELRVDTYYFVESFQEVTEIHMPT
ncbi:pyridoxamine 5'-phosphate oxidase family protein [Lentisphaerota bacterium ZTH]|nr:pyridoxamine 5'-phosphate oxidase family protein [Lentisphaerota bacterium]WET05315.1 pyridoxamine 5'-phosphate oxidase family protein [Lentisphaerota bacterium ZTH]